MACSLCIMACGLRIMAYGHRLLLTSKQAPPDLALLPALGAVQVHIMVAQLGLATVPYHCRLTNSGLPGDSGQL